MTDLRLDNSLEWWILITQMYKKESQKRGRSREAEKQRSREAEGWFGHLICQNLNELSFDDQRKLKEREKLLFLLEKHMYRELFWFFIGQCWFTHICSFTYSYFCFCAQLMFTIKWHLSSKTISNHWIHFLKTESIFLLPSTPLRFKYTDIAI